MKHLLRYTLSLLTALLPMLAMAQVDPKIQVNKYVTENANGTYTLDLETYATGYTKQTMAYVPTDFVLVLDRSGSMFNDYMSGDRVATGTTLTTSRKYKIVKSDGRTYNLWYMGSGTGSSARTKNKWHTSYSGYYLDDVKYDPTDYEYYGGELFYNNTNYVVKATDEIYETLEQTRMDALKIAVQNFLDAVFENNPTEGKKHRVATIWYAGSSSSKPYGRVSDYLGNYSNLSTTTTKSYELKELVGSSAGTGQETLTNYKNKIGQVTKTFPDQTGLGTGTITALGLKVAYNTLMAAKDDGRNKVVVFFTDGEPGTSSGKFYVPDARESCQFAADIKSSNDLKNTVEGQSGNSKTFDPIIYSIGIMDCATSLYHATSSLDGTGTAYSNDKYQFLHYISSNYIINRSSFSSYNFNGSLSPTCQGATTDGTACTGHGSEDPHGYFMRCDGADLSNAFAEIAKKEIKDRNENLGTSTVIKDAMTDDFKLPDGATAADINLYTCAAKADNKTADLVWSTTGTGGEIVYKDAADEKVPAAVTGGHAEYWVPLTSTSVSTTISGKQVLVTGYDFKENFVGVIHDFTGATNDIAGWTGEKFIMEFVIERDPATPGANYELDTNTDKSGVYLSGTDTDPLLAYPVPNVPVPNIIITKKGLAVGESAVFEVERVTSSAGTSPDATNVFKNTYILTKTDTSIDPSIEFVSSGPGYYKVTEKTWTWNDKVTYDSGTDGTPDTEGNSYVQQLTNTDTKKQFTFGVGSSPKTGVLPRYQSEKNKNNVF